MESDQRKPMATTSSGSGYTAPKTASHLKSHYSESTQLLRPNNYSRILVDPLPWKKRKMSVLHYLNESRTGEAGSFQFKDTKKLSVINHITRFRALNPKNSLKRRATAIAWHPTYSQVAAVASKAGELYLYDMKLKQPKIFPLTRFLAPVMGVKFNKNDLVYTISNGGCIKEMDVLSLSEKRYLKNDQNSSLFSSFELCFEKNIVLGGDASGYVHFSSLDALKMWSSKKQLHCSSVTHLEFSPFDSHIFSSASSDKTVKIWDFRMMATEPEPIRKFSLKNVVNSVHFSPSSRNTILATDDEGEIRLYRGKEWNEELIIHHPHCQSPHVQPITATWHPFVDIFVIGRHAKRVFHLEADRAIDFYDGSNGMLLRTVSLPPRCISSMNAFNATGDTVISCIGCSVIFWKDRKMFKEYDS